MIITSKSCKGSVCVHRLPSTLSNSEARLKVQITTLSIDLTQAGGAVSILTDIGLQYKKGVFSG